MIDRLFEFELTDGVLVLSASDAAELRRELAAARGIVSS
jgi:hypothetical protein